MIPRFDGAILSFEWKDAVWDRYVTGAPRPRTPSEQQYSDRKLRSRRWSRELGINPKTVAKWRKRVTVEDLKTRPAETPDRMVFDLDPDEGLAFGETKRAAEHLKEQLAELGLTSFPMLSGGKGVHVIVPLTPEAAWSEVKSFAERFARALASADPERFVATMTKSKRSGRVFIDWLRNQHGSTAVLPYSVRARAGAPVAAPVSWTELREIETAGAWTLRDTETFRRRAASPALAGWGMARQTLPDVWVTMHGFTSAGGKG